MCGSVLQRVAACCRFTHLSVCCSAFTYPTLPSLHLATPQCVAAYCNVLHVVHPSVDAIFAILQLHMCCSVLQCVAVCCSVLQCVAECCSAFNHLSLPYRNSRMCCSEVHCVADCCTCVAILTSRNVLQCVAVCCDALQCVAVCCTCRCHL